MFLKHSAYPTLSSSCKWLLWTRTLLVYEDPISSRPIFFVMDLQLTLETPT